VNGSLVAEGTHNSTKLRLLVLKLNRSCKMFTEEISQFFLLRVVWNLLKSDGFDSKASFCGFAKFLPFVGYHIISLSPTQTHWPYILFRLTPLCTQHMLSFLLANTTPLVP